MLEIFFNNLVQIIGIVLFLVFLFILGREFVLWYFKININIENQNRIIFLLEKLMQKNIKSEKALDVLMEPDQNSDQYKNRSELPASEKQQPIKPKYCFQCGKLISGRFPIIITEHGKTKYFCSDDCRLNDLEVQ